MREHPMSRFHLFCLPLTAALVVALSACGKSADMANAPDPETSAEAIASGTPPEDTRAPVKMDDTTLKAVGIRVQVLQPSALSEELRAPGEVVDNAYGTTLITPRIEALVIRRHAKLGDEVRAGAPLVTLSSVDVANAQADLRIAEQEWRRVSALGREAVSGRRINEAEVAVDRARATARAYGLPGTATGRSNGEFTLTAPHAGRITEDDFVVGERIEPGKTLFRLVDESVVWVDAKMPSGTMPRVTTGAPATIVFNGERFPGTVQRSAHRTSDATRNAVVRIEVPNTPDRLHGGDFVEVFLKAGTGGSVENSAATDVTMPTDALVQLQGETVAFRRNSNGALEAVPVRTGDVIGDRTVIREGLKAGDVVVVEGAFAVKAQMLKSQLGEE